MEKVGLEPYLHFPRGKERSLLPLISVQVRGSARALGGSNSLHSWGIPWTNKVAYFRTIKRGQG